MDSLENDFIERQPNSLIGREDELMAVKKRLLREEVHLLTLTGAAGVGKTRLAIAATDEMRSAFAQVVFVDLVPIISPAQVLPTIARSCGVLEGLPGVLSQRLAQAIGSRHLLLVLDNCEHVIEAMPELSTLLRSCPNLKILATSREILKLKWEWVFSVPPLQLPEIEKLPALDTLAQIPSVTLFLQRAQARDTGFSLTPDNARIIAELCIRLDGLPLAIELAANQVSSLGPKTLLEYLTEAPALLTEGSRDAPVRHQTLKAAIDWSYALLSPSEKILFFRLSLFFGSWSLQAAMGVCTGDGLEENNVSLMLNRLVNCSLVVVVKQKDGSMRYRFLETVREYAKDRLRESGAEEEMYQRHRDWFLSWAEQNEPKRWGSEMPEWLEQCETDFYNFLAALEWSRKTPGESACGLRLIAALYRFWDIRGHYSSIYPIARELLELAPDATAARTRTLIQTSFLAREQGEWHDSRLLAEECLTLSRQLGNVLDASGSLIMLGTLEQIKGESQRALALYEEAVTMARSHHDQEPRALYSALYWLGAFICLQGDNDRAITLFEESLSYAKHQGDCNINSLILIGMGRALLGQGGFTRATTFLLDGLRACQKLENYNLGAYCLDFLGQVAWSQKEKQCAIKLLGAAALLRARIGVITWFPDPNYETITTDLGLETLQSIQSSITDLSLKEIVAWALSQETPAVQKVESEMGLINLPDTHQLSDRELEIAVLIAEGLRNRDIATKLFLSRHTVESHIHRILNKLAVKSRSQIATWYTAHR